MSLQLYEEEALKSVASFYRPSKKLILVIDTMSIWLLIDILRQKNRKIRESADFFSQSSLKKREKNSPGRSEIRRGNVERTFLEKLGPKILNGLFKVNFGTKTNSNVQNLMVICTFSILNGKYTF